MRRAARPTAAPLGLGAVALLAAAALAGCGGGEKPARIFATENIVYSGRFRLLKTLPDLKPPRIETPRASGSGNVILTTAGGAGTMILSPQGQLLWYASRPGRKYSGFRVAGSRLTWVEQQGTRFFKVTAGPAYEPIGREPTAAAGSQRAVRATWTAKPGAEPRVVAQKGSGNTIIFVSWNGAVGVAGWRVLGGDSRDGLKALGTSPFGGIETRISVNRTPGYVQLLALDDGGQVIGRSVVVKV